MITAELAKTARPELSPVDALFALVADDMTAADAMIHERMSSTVALIPDLSRHLIDSGGKGVTPVQPRAAARSHRLGCRPEAVR